MKRSASKQVATINCSVEFKHFAVILVLLVLQVLDQLKIGSIDVNEWLPVPLFLFHMLRAKITQRNVQYQ